MSPIRSLTICTAAVAVGVLPVLAQEIEPSAVVRPDDAPRHEAPASELVEAGADLFADPALSANGTTSCSTCHSGFRSYKETFREPYPHEVGMATTRAGLDEITAETMVQLCMIVPMGADPLPWGSRELAALTAYVKDERERFAERAE
jgi:cytochrome c peroxidase